MYQNSEDKNTNEETQNVEVKKEKNSATLWISLVCSVFILVISILALLVFLPIKSNGEKIVETNETIEEKAKFQENESDQLALDMALTSDKSIEDGSVAPADEQSSLTSDIKVVNVIEIPEDNSSEKNSESTYVQKDVEKVEPYVPPKKQTVKQPVVKKVIEKKAPINVTKFYIQVGSFEKLTLAENAKSYWTDKGLNTVIKTKGVNGKTMYRVQVGTFSTKTEVDAYLVKVKATKGFENAFVTAVTVTK